jgi:acyl dehydratase
MELSGVGVGNAPRHGPFPADVDPERVAAYAAAVGDQTSSVLDGDATPAVFPVIFVLEPQYVTHADLPAQAWQDARGGLHGEHEVVIHRPPRVGETLQTYAQISGVRTVRAGVQVVAHFEQLDDDGHVVVEQWWTMMLLGVRSLADYGVPPPDHRFPESARDRLFGSVVHHIPGDAAQHYAEVSGDWAAHHFDIDAARASGSDYVFTHGLYTMAVCGHRMLELAGIGDPGRVSRMAVRFAAPTRLGADLTVNAYALESNSFAFEAVCDGVKTITHGRMEFRS